jgi:hypothetical protein
MLQKIIDWWNERKAKKEKAKRFAKILKEYKKRDPFTYKNF